MTAEVEFETLRDAHYDRLAEPLLIAGSTVEQVRDFRRQQGLEHLGFVCVPSPGWEGYMGSGKVLLLLPGDRTAAEWDAVRAWVNGEEWTFSVPAEHFDLAQVEREMEIEAELRADRHAWWWRRATMVAAVVCLLLAGASTRSEGAEIASLPWFVAACGWLAAMVVAGR